MKVCLGANPSTFVAHFCNVHISEHIFLYSNCCHHLGKVHQRVTAKVKASRKHPGFSMKRTEEVGAGGGWEGGRRGRTSLCSYETLLICETFCLHFC